MRTRYYSGGAFVLWAMLFAAVSSFAQELPPDEAWEPITIGDSKGYIVPDVVLEGLGIPRRSIAPEDNAATYYLPAIEALEASHHGLRESDPDGIFFKAIGDNPPDRIPDPLLEWFQTTAPIRDLIRKASSLDECQFPMIVSRPGGVSLYALLLPHLAAMRQFARLMAFEGRVHEARGEPDQAMESYIINFRLAAHVGQGDALITGLVGVACHSIGCRAMERLLATGSLSAEALERLQRELQTIGPRLPDRTRWIPMERAASKQMVDVSMDNPGYGFGVIDSKIGSDLIPTTFTQSRVWRIVFPDRVLKEDFDHFYGHMAEVGALPPWQTIAEWRQHGGESQIKDSVHDWNILAWLLLPALDRADAEYIKMQTDYTSLCCNVALRRYKVVHEEYPDTLDALVPDFINAPLLDPFSGEPFHYRLKDGEWTLWSVGSDQDDDDGKTVGRNWREDGDIVWTSVAGEGEK